MSLMALPVIHSDAGLVRYLQEVNKFPLLTEEEEFALSTKWHENQDLKSAHTLITSHLRLVAKIALKFNGYGLPIVDIISEGNLGLMHAVRKFNPYHGNRFSTYAIWWIKAYIQDYILKSWSLVKIGTSAVKKKLFYNLNKMKNKISALTGEKDSQKQLEVIAETLDVSETEALDMNRMMSQNLLSLNTHVSDDDDTELGDFIADTSPNQEVILIEKDELAHRKALLINAMETLSEREKDIISMRMLNEKPTTLEVLSKKYGISCERIRQIEAKAFEKLKSLMMAAA
jgi:RNA polymerase sigma-32 factor